MPEIPNIEKANECNILWPPLSDAVDTFLKRRASGCEAYERTWRLIHVWEAVAITLCSAGVSRLRDLPTRADLYRKIREQLHGRSWNALSKSFDRFQGVLDGAMVARQNVLWELGSAEITESAFLLALRGLLLAESINLRSLIQAWGRICDVPPEVQTADPLTVREVLRHVNSFRNRIAHVPFPYDGLEDVADGLEEVTEQLFSIEPKPWQGFQNDERRESALTGAIIWRNRALRGNMPYRTNLGEPNGVAFCYPAQQKKDAAPELWPSDPFIYVDAMLRPYVLTRLRSQASGVWEFTRFRAEANSVITREHPQWLLLLAVPTEQEYRGSQELQEEDEDNAAVDARDVADGQDGEPLRRAQDFEEALRFIRNEDYRPAIDYFARLVQVRPQYHIGWLRLGHSQRELAMRIRIDSPVESAQLLADSITSLTRAANHVERERRAQALYERSKAHYHLGRLLSEPNHLQSALTDAKDAFALSPGSSYETWIAYLLQHGVRPTESAAT